MKAIKASIRAVMRRIAQALDKLSGGKITPNMVTMFGFLMHIPIAFLVATRHNYWAAGLLLVFGLLDTADGELARLQKRESARGMLLDSVTDRVKEVFLYVGAAYAIIATTGRPYLAVWAVAACGCSLLVSYVNAWGDAVSAKYAVVQHDVNKAFRGGLLPFEIRMFIFLVGLVSGRLALAAVVITVGAAYTALMRLLGVFEKLGKSNVQS